MIRPVALLLMLSLAAPVAAQVPPGKSQRVAGSGMRHSDGLNALAFELYGEAVRAAGRAPDRYFSRALQARLAADRSRPVPRLAADWFIHPDAAWPSDAFYAHVLNTTGGSADRPGSASVSLGFRDRPGWGRRLGLIEQDGYWVIDNVCMFPQRAALRDVLNSPGPTEPDHDPAPPERHAC